MAHAGTAKRYYKHEALMRYAKLLNFGEIHTKIDNETGMHAIIAIHNTRLGPAIGGTRFYEYSSSGPALKDALRLAYMMTLKAATSQLAHGGAKAVIIKPKHLKDREALFRSFGDFVHEMNGRYITAVDMGTTSNDMDIIATRTPYVIGATGTRSHEGDPAPHTAEGVLRGIEAAVQFALNKNFLEDVHVAIQGLGNVGSELVKRLHARGARITACDSNQEVVEDHQEKYGITAVDIEEIYDTPCDVFAPCAMGGALNLNTINRLNTKIIAGSANNQLAHRKYNQLIHDKGILYAPDYVINAGGLIYAAMIYDCNDLQRAQLQIDNLYDIMLTIFKRAKETGQTTLDVADHMALERLAQAPRPGHFLNHNHQPLLRESE